MAEQAKSLKVFVSYSRADVGFADQLVLALEDKGFDPILDRHDISGAENWRERLGKLILSADAVAFVLTAKSAASEICSWEVGEAVRLGKRVIPVTPGNIDGVTPPKALSELNWIPFYAEPAIPGSGFYYGVKRLMEALSIDLDWLRAQTRYSERALEWAKEKPDDLLLRGEALKEAEAWQARSPAGSQLPELVRDYLAASGDAEQHRQAAAKVQLAEREQALKTAEAAVADSRAAQGKLRRFTQWALGGGVVLLLLAAIGNFFAVTTTLDANDRRAALFATAANQLSLLGDYNRGLLVALSGDPAARSGMIEGMFRQGGNPAARAALVRAFAGDRLSYASAPGAMVTELTALPDGHRFVTFHTDGRVQIWDAALPDPLVPQAVTRTPFLVDRAFALPDGDHIAMSWLEAGVALPALWSLAAKKVDRQFELGPGAEFGAATALALSQNGKYLVAGFDGGLVIWDTAKTTPLHVKSHDFLRVTSIAITDDSETVVAATGDSAMVWQPADETFVGPVESQLGEIASLAVFDGDSVVVGVASGQLGIVNPATAKISDAQSVLSQEMSPEDANGIQRIALSPDDRLFYMLTTRGELKVLRTETTLELKLAAMQRDLTRSVFLTGVNMFATASKDGVVRLWTTARAERGGSVSDDLPGGYRMIANAPAGVMFGLSFDNEMFRWMRGAAKPELIKTADSSPVLSMNSDGSLYAVPTAEGVAIHRWGETKPLKTIPLVQISDKSAAAAELVFLPDDKRLLVVSGASEASLWSLDQDARLGSLVKLEYHSSLAISPDGSWIATGLNTHDNGLDYGVTMDVVEMMKVDRYSVVTIWDVASGAAQRLTVEGNVTALAIAPDNARLAFGLQEGGMGLYQKGETLPRQTFVGHPNHLIHALAFDAGGGMLLSSGEDGLYRLWQMGEREALQTFDAFGDFTVAGAFDPDGKHVIGIDDNRIARWAIDPIVSAGVDEQMKMACRRLEARGIAGFTRQDKLEMTFLDDVANDPCLKLGFNKKKPVAKR